MTAHPPGSAVDRLVRLDGARLLLELLGFDADEVMIEVRRRAVETPVDFWSHFDELKRLLLLNRDLLRCSFCGHKRSLHVDGWTRGGDHDGCYCVGCRGDRGWHPVAGVHDFEAPGYVHWRAPGQARVNLERDWLLRVRAGEEATEG